MFHDLLRSTTTQRENDTLMNRLGAARRWLLLGGAAAIAATVGVTHVAAEWRAAVSSSAPVAGQTPSVSADGRFVVYAGAPADMSDGHTSTVYLRDRLMGWVTELTKSVPGLRPGNSVMPVLSADGCTVAVITEYAFDLFRDDDAGDRWDVYVERLPSCGGTLGQWSLVSTVAGGGFDASASDAVSPTFAPAMSGEGATVVYTERFSLDAPDMTRVTLVDLTIPMGQAGRSSSVGGTPLLEPDSTFRYSGVREPSISADGSVVAFTSDADHTGLLGEWGSGPQPGAFATSNVFVWNRSSLDPAAAVRRISVVGTPTGDASSPAVSGDGSVVAFVSTATNLVPGATLPPCASTCVPQVYLIDLSSGSLALVSRVPGDPTEPPVAADLGATLPSVDRTGDEVAFVTRATNLFATRSSEVGGPLDGDVVVAVPATGDAQRVTVLADGVTPAPAASSHPKLSASGRVVVFDTLAGAAFGGSSGKGRSVTMIDRPPKVTMSGLDMGSIVVGFPGPEWYLVVDNPGPSSFVPALVEVDNPDFLISGGTCVDQVNIPVPPGGSCTVNLMFMPSKDGPADATLTVHEYGFDAVAISSHLHGFGGEPALSPTPGGADGGAVVVGAESEPMAFGIFNIAFNHTTVSGIRLDGENPADFKVVTDTCSGQALVASAGCVVQVVFAPTGSGRRTAHVVATTDKGSYTTMLVSGDGRWEPTLSASSSTVVAPSKLKVEGSGFSPFTAVTVGWADGSGRSVVTISDPYGTISVELVVRPGQRGGQRTVVAQTADGQTGTVDVDVVMPRSTPIAKTTRRP